MTKLILRSLLLLVILATPFSILSPLKADDGEYLFILKGRGNVFWKVIREGVEETAKARGMKAVILNTDDDQTPEAQLNMCLASLARKPKIIVLGAATKNVGIECYRKAAAQGILAADIDGNVTVQDAKDANVPLAFSVGSDNTLIGKSAAEYLAKSSNKTDPLILVIKGLPGSIVSEKRAQGFLDQIKISLPAAKIVGMPAGNWDRLKAMNTAIDYMQREPKLDYIFSIADVMTMGVIEGVRIAGKIDAVKVFSVDGMADARKALIDGRIAANVAQLPFLMGKRAVELALAASQGEVTNSDEFIPIPVLTREVLERNEDPNFVYLR